MESPAYIMISSVWQELFVTGLLPFISLVYCNIRIYTKIRESSKHEKHRYEQEEKQYSLMGMVDAAEIFSFVISSITVEFTFHQFAYCFVIEFLSSKTYFYEYFYL